MCHPSTGEKDVCDYFGKLGFVRHFSLKNIQEKKLSRESHSTHFLYPWIYGDFKLIVTIDNPYRRIVKEFKKFSHINWELKSRKKEELSLRFNSKFDEMFSDDLFLLKKLNNEKEQPYNFLLPYNFTSKVPDYTIDISNLINDVKKIIFLDHLDYDFSLVDQLDLSDEYKNVFSYENARVIYKVHKHIFDLMRYDPFSFTTHDLTQKEKIHFIHY